MINQKKKKKNTQLSREKKARQPTGKLSRMVQNLQKDAKWQQSRPPLRTVEQAKQQVREADQYKKQERERKKQERARKKQEREREQTVGRVQISTTNPKMEDAKRTAKFMDTGFQQRSQELLKKARKLKLNTAEVEIVNDLDNHLDLLMAGYIENDWTPAKRNVQRTEAEKRKNKVNEMIKKHEENAKVRQQYLNKDETYTNNIKKVIRALKKYTLLSQEEKVVEGVEDQIELLMMYYEGDDPFDKTARNGAYNSLVNIVEKLKTITAKYKKKKPNTAPLV